MDNPTSPATISPKPPISLNLAFLLITLISLLLSVFFIFQNWRLNQKLNALIQSQSIPTPSVANPPLAETPSADPTANWKTYFRIANFTFQFPNDWTEQPNYSLQSGNKLMTVWIEGDTVGLECLALTKSLKKSVNESVFDLKYYDGIKSASCDTSGNKIIFFLFPVGNKKYSFTFDYSDSNKEESEKLFDQILSTFKFTK